MIVVIYGKDYTKNTYEALAASDILTYLKPGMSAAIKPNLVVPGPASNGATTHPEVVEGIILFLKDHGITDMKIIESSWVGDSTKRAFKYCNYEPLSDKYGIPLIDLKSDSATTLNYGGNEYKINNEALNTDFLINVPVMKAHCQTLFTCCMKNLKGCIPDSEKRRFHTLGLHKPIAELNMLLKTGYNVVDGICGDLSFEEGGNPVESNRIIVGRNPLAVDSYCAELIGYKPDEIGYLSYGKKLGLGETGDGSLSYSQDREPSPVPQIIELNTNEKSVHIPGEGPVAKKYAHLIDEDAACSACYSSLIYALHKFEKTGVVLNHLQICHSERSEESLLFEAQHYKDPSVAMLPQDDTVSMISHRPHVSKIHIGQGFKGRSGDGIGVGDCARGFAKNVPGCPPKATEIIGMLNQQG